MQRTEGGWIWGHRCDALNSDLIFSVFRPFPVYCTENGELSGRIFFILLFWVPGRYGLINTLLSSSHHFANKHAPSPSLLLPYFYSHDKRKIKRMQRFFPIFFVKPLYFLLERKRICCVWEGGRGGVQQGTENIWKF